MKNIQISRSVFFLGHPTSFEAYVKCVVYVRKYTKDIHHFKELVILFLVSTGSAFSEFEEYIV